jgi:hypothetical protein
VTAGPLARPGRTAVRIIGDYYQWLVAWQACFTALHDKAEHRTNPVIAVGVEVNGAGNLDDVVLYRKQPPHTRIQVKYAVDSRTPIDTDYVTKPSTDGGPSILRKIADGWNEFTQDGAPVDVALMTNRAPSATDALMAGRDSRTGLLMPAAGEQTRRSARGQLRAVWAESSGLTEERLLALLGVLRFDTARDLTHVEHITSLLMTINGLRGDHQHVRAGADWVAEQVQNGHRRLDLDMIEAAVAERGIRTEAPRSVLSVATLKPDPLRTQAIHALDWVDRFDGADAYAKRQPQPPATWSQLQTDIEQIPNHLAGARRIMLTGSIRQATAFTIGATLRMVTNVNLAVIQGDQLWTTDTDYTEPITPTVAEHPLDQGDDLAVAVAVATQMTDDALTFLRTHQVPVDRLVVLQPPGGAKDNSIATPAAAVALAVGIRDQTRRTLRHPRRIHLFLAGPMGLSLLLGHRWNRVAPTTVYEEIRSEAQYHPAFEISA